MSPLLLSLRFLQAQPDSRLVALTRQGHGPAFETLVRRYRGELLAYCRRLQPRSGLAEDALQQTLLQAWKALSEGAEVREVRAWLYRIAHNVSLNHLRAANAVPQELADAAVQPALDQLVEQRLRARAALAGVASLPTLQREALLSTTFDGASHTEVASALGLSSGAVRGLIYRARETLRAAAAALTPAPVLHWALRRADVGSGRFTSAGATFVGGGGGAGAAGAIAKGGAVLALALASTSGVVLMHQPSHHREPKSRLVRSQDGARPPGGADASALIAVTTTGFAGSAPGAQRRQGMGGATARRDEAGERAERGRRHGSVGGDRRGSSGGGGNGVDDRRDSDGGSTSGSDGGSTSDSTEGDTSTFTTAAAASTGPGEGGSSSGPDGGSGSSSGTSAPTTSGSDGDVTTPSATTAAGTSSGSGGGSGGSSGGSDGSSGSSDGSSPSGG